MTEPLRTPAPPGFSLADVNPDQVAAKLAGAVEEHMPELFGELMALELRWLLDLEDLDGEGWTTIQIVRVATGEEVGVCPVHWSELA